MDLTSATLKLERGHPASAISGFFRRCACWSARRPKSRDPVFLGEFEKASKSRVSNRSERATKQPGGRRATALFSRDGWSVPRELRIRAICEAFGTPSSYLDKEQWNAVASRSGLSTRQLAIVQAIIDGLHEDSIGARLGLSPSTVHTHATRLHRKLDVHDRTSLVVRVFVAHLICEREVSKTTELVG